MSRPTSTTTGHRTNDMADPAASDPAHDMRSARRLVARRARGWLTTWTAVTAGLLVVGPLGAAIVVDRVDSLTTSIWEFVGGPLGWAVLALAVVVGSVSLPLFVAYGISRRAVLQTYALLGAGLALASGLVMALGYTVEGSLYEQLGAGQALRGTHLYGGPEQWPAVVLEHGLRGATMLLTGWVVGLAFYRYEWWTGLAATAAALIPYGLGAWTLASGRPALAVTVSVAGVAVLAAAAYLLGRDLPVRPRSG